MIKSISCFKIVVQIYFKMLYNIRKEDKDEDRETLTGRNEITGYNAKGTCDEIVDITTDGFTVGYGGERTEL